MDKHCPDANSDADFIKHKHLAKTPLFWFAMLAPIICGLVLAGLIYKYSGVGDLCARAECIQNFFDRFKFPITLAGLALPFIALVAAIQRSKETSLQISLASMQYGEAIKNNRFGNYLKHREGFDKLIEGYNKRAKGETVQKPIIETPSLYADIFPDSGFNNRSWHGQHNTKLLAAIEKNAATLMLQMQAPLASFNISVFLAALGYLSKALKIHYAKPCFIKHVNGENEITVMTPHDADLPYVLFLLITDVFALLAFVRSYVGTNNSDDLMYGPYIDQMFVNLKGTSSSYSAS
jgi:hypothetical protein